MCLLAEVFGRFHGCTQVVPNIYSTHYMIEYGRAHGKQLSQPDYHVEERKAARKKLLDEIFRRRGQRYRAMMERKRRLQGNSNLATIA